VRLTHLPLARIDDAKSDEIGVSRTGTIAIAEATIVQTNESLLLVSMYGLWEQPHPTTASSWTVGYSDASVHRLISDLSMLIGHERGHRIIAAGDLNILYGYGENGNRYWHERYDTVFSRMSALGLEFVGPQAPDGGIQADPWPRELPPDSKNVPTYQTTRGNRVRQLDFVFASAELRDRIQVHALNTSEEWGPSDHSRIVIELDTE